MRTRRVTFDVNGRAKEGTLCNIGRPEGPLRRLREPWATAGASHGDQGSSGTRSAGRQTSEVAGRLPDVDDAEAYRRLAQLFAEIDKWNAGEAEPAQVQAGSRTAADDEATDPYHLSHAVAVALGAAHDHLHSLRTLIADAGTLHTSSPFTLLRAAMEGAAQALWLLEPDDRRVRVLRRFQMAVRDADERRGTHVRIMADDLSRTAEAERRFAAACDRFAELSGRSGIARQEVLQRSKGFGAMVAASGPAAGVSAEQMEGMWRLASGYAHGQSWSLIGTGDLAPQGSWTEDGVRVYRITADVPTVWMVASLAVLATKQARYLQHKHRLRYRTHGASS